MKEYISEWRIAKQYVICFFCIWMIGESVFAQLSLPKVFADNMVIQREIEVPIWGKSFSSDTITVVFNQQKKMGIANEKGDWKINLPKQNAGGPYDMILSSSTGQVIEFHNILVGDVWFASGQSNMEWQVQQAKDADLEIKNANYNKIRFFNVEHAKELIPQEEVRGGEWEVCDSLSVKDKSAVAYYFGRYLHKDLNVPIGIIQSTWGGTPVEAWTSREQLLNSNITSQTVKDNDSITSNHFVQDSLDLVRFWEIVYQPEDKVINAYSALGYDDGEWEKLTMPSTFKSWDMGNYEGMMWLRKHIRIKKEMLGNALHIYLGHPEMNYSLYFNGKEICKNVWNAEKTHDYTIPSEIVREGDNVIAVRMAVLWGGGGFNPPSDNMYLTDGVKRISLAEKWLYKRGLEPKIPTIKNYHQYPTYLYNGMINPLVTYGIKGFIWYQGENNADKALDYATLFPLMIKDWRKRWGLGDLPFLYVQLANYMKVKPEPGLSNWALLRESQTKALSLPNTGMACIIDLGEADQIHPKNKQEVGRRLALVAEKQVYKKDVNAYGPVIDHYTIEGDQVILHFKNTNEGLKVRNNGALKGFAVAGINQQFYWAKAVIQGDKVVVSSDKVKKPVAVRYAWADNPECNLINSDDLPAIPFRTDDWDAEEK